MPATAALADSVQMPESASDLAHEWSDLHFRSPITSQLRSRWRPAAALVVVLLHIALLSALLMHRLQGSTAQEQRIEISFIERAAVQEPQNEEASKPPGSRQSKTIPAADTKSNSLLRVVETAHQEPAPLRLHLAPDEWHQPATPPENNPLSRDIKVQLPGRAEAFVDGVRFEPPMSPEKVLRAIAIKNFGGIDPDPCPDARQRLADLESNRDRYAIESNLRKVERYCRP